MKKIFTTAFALMAALTPLVTGAQEAASYQRLDRVYEPEYGEYYRFVYDDNTGLLQQVDEYFDMRVRTGYTYNDKNQCTRQTLYQEIPVSSNNLYATSYYEFAYDEQGRMATSSLYGNFKPTDPASEFELQVIEYFTYDSQGRLSDSETYWGSDKSTPYSKTERVYNTAGLLSTITENQYDFGSGALASIMRTTYTYDEAGKPLTTCTEKTPENSTDITPVVSAWTNYVYSADGNLEERYTTGRVNSPDAKVTRMVFAVDENVPASEVIYPELPQPYRESELYPLFVNQIITADEYYPDDDSGLAGPAPFYAWEYEYSTVGNHVGIAAADAVAGKRLSGATVDGDVLRLHGILQAGSVRIVDLNGREVLSAPAVANRVDVSGLAKGVYVVTTAAGSAKFVR